MKHLSLEQTADYLEDAIITTTLDQGFALVHVGERFGTRFVLVNDAKGGVTLSEE